MDGFANLPTIYWTISCFDKRRREPLPVYNRHFVLEWRRLDKRQIADVVSIVNGTGHEDPAPSSLHASVISIRRYVSRPDNRMLQYRQYFVEAQGLDWARGDHVPVDLGRDYFEDENGAEITEYEMYQYVTGKKQPVIVGNPESIITLGTSPPRNCERWTESSSNTIAQFLDVVRGICESNWYLQSQSLTFEIPSRDSRTLPDPGNSRMLEAVFPTDGETLSVLAYFRQLHAGDKLLSHACKSYINACSDPRKVLWIDERMRSFARLVDSPPTMFSVSHTRREIIRMFMYGAGLLHATSKHGDDKKLHELIGSQGKERAVTVFNHCLHDILSPAIDVYRVIKTDFKHWIAKCGLTPPTRMDIPELFNGFTPDQ